MHFAWQLLVSSAQPWFFLKYCAEVMCVIFSNEKHTFEIAKYHNKEASNNIFTGYGEQKKIQTMISRAKSRSRKKIK